MWKYVCTVLGSIVFMSAVAQANPFAESTCRQVLPENWRCVTVAAGTSWEQVVPDPEYRLIIQKYNRQNTPLWADQYLVVPPPVPWNELAPFPRQATGLAHDQIVFDPRALAWAHYLGGELITWGPAVGGKDWCKDVGRSCRTDVGNFHFTEAAGPNRRSSAYPVGCSGRGCAPMPYFLRFTTWGQGIHARNMRGANASHGCIGVFADDAVYLNGHVRARVGTGRYGYFTAEQLERSRSLVHFLVLPYEDPARS